jgi:methyl-accepting chemotaxis protein
VTTYLTALITVLSLALTAVPSAAEMTVQQLAAESEAYVKTTLQATPSKPETIAAKVEEACALLAKEGPAAFPRFKGTGSSFLFEGTYIWVHTLKETRMLMHPLKYKMEGRELADLKDERGKAFFGAMNDLARTEGQGWVGYHWPVPGSKEIVYKVSFVKKCTMANGVEVVVGAGLYHVDPADIERLKIR